MRSPRMKKVDFAVWLNQLHEELVEMGGEHFDYQLAETFTDGSGSQPHIPGYRFETIYGTLVLHPDVAIDSRDLDCAVYGKFADVNNATRRAANVHYKWNHEYGVRPVDEFPLVIADLCARLERLLLPVAAAA